ncbi:MAG: LysR family transcriptional regulator [Alphaproteobacteria bacterium]|nr:LysR family transcriptional regulator [Alphaproteobacteria bacterium]
MDTKQLKAFAAVAELGSFSRAAVALSLGQPVLSRQIKSLESELGARLLHRNGRGIILTEAGKLLDRYAKGILETTSKATSEIAALQSAPRGTVIIGMPPSVGFVLTVPLVQQFRATYPLIAIRVIEGFSGYLLEWLLTGKVDVAVLYNAPRMPNVLSEPLLRDQLFLLGAAEDPSRLAPGAVPARRLPELPLILPSRPHGLRLVIDQVLGKAGITLDPELEVDAMPSTLRLVEQGLGYTILSYSSVHHLVEDGRIRTWPIVEPDLTRQLILATSSQRPTTTATRALTELVRRQVRELVRKGLWHPRRVPQREPA